MKNKKTITTLALFAVLLALPFVVADSYELYCLGPGEQIDFGSLCNPAMDARTGPGNYCVHNLDSGSICPASPNVCNSLGLGCSESNEGTSLDITPPVLTINSPFEGEIYSDRGIELDLDVDEIADIDYQDKSDTSRWKQVCTRCSSYSRERSFEEGLNDLTFRVRDVAGNTAFFDISFRIDSKAPRIRSVSPTSGFTSGLFEIEFEELSPTSLIINYGNDETGFHTHSVDLDSECVVDRNTLCTTQIDLSSYNGEQIEYYVELTDVAGSTDMSSTNFLEVDHSNPSISSLETLKDGRYVTFILEVNEPFFSEAAYFENVGNNPREKKICSRLDSNNQCEKRVSFPDGNHEVDIIVRDQAGNEEIQTLQFLIDSKGPKIRDISPEGRGFASGLFEVWFDETAPTSVVLTYGNEETGMRTKDLNINSDCSVQNEDEYFCSTQVSLNDYDGQEIEYMFKVMDVAENMDEDGGDQLKVDISHPIFNSVDYTINGRYVTFILDVTESNLDEITYFDHSDSNARERRLCSSLDSNNQCEKRVSFKDGTHVIDLVAKDESGLLTAQSVEIFTDSKKPRITDVFPERRDFASGLFEVEFREMNPENLVLSYGNEETGMRT
ncbi:MAG: hypothetical protein KC506_01385, partial [Nanoarchaeota archaeon]|nr:hypothetical protein [Nanoarchaeota archaeon]